jgi:MYXO-CTERM domain-containing protein
MMAQECSALGRAIVRMVLCENDERAEAENRLTDQSDIGSSENAQGCSVSPDGTHSASPITLLWIFGMLALRRRRR